MLQLQVIVVDKAPALAEIVDVLILQYAGVKSRLIMLRKCPMNRIPQQSCQEAGSVIVLSPRHDAGSSILSQPSAVISIETGKPASPLISGISLTGGSVAAAYCRSWMAASSAERTASKSIFLLWKLN